MLASALCFADDEVVFRSDTTLVRLDVQVLDTGRRAITGLEKEAFHLRENGKEVAIKSFAAEAMAIALMANFAQVGLGSMADPTDTSYVPRPEWYFLFLFQLLRLKMFGGEFGQFLGAVALPGAFMALLAALPFIDKDPERNIFKRPIALIGWIVVMAMILLFTVAAIINREFLD